MNDPAMGRVITLARMVEIAAQPDHDWRVYLASLEYIKMGWFVVPITPNSKKLPRADTNVNYGSSSRRRKIMDKWFHPDNGTFKGYNIGIATGREGGAFVMDVDRHGEVDGAATLKRLEDEHGKVPDCPVAITPNDGKHYFFQWQENASQSSGKIGKGIDTRGGDADACRGHVVAFPSTINGKMYKWQGMCKTPEIPIWIMEKMGVLWKPKPSNAKGLGNEHVTDADLEQPITEAQIVTMLNAIDPDELGYDDWLKMGMSVKSQLNNEVGLAIWDEWSQKGKRYKAGECDIRWNGFSDFGTVRGGTLFYFAKEAGWKPDPTKGERGGNPFDELVTRMNKEYAICAVGGELRILREKQTIVNEWESPYDLLKKATFEGLLQNDIIWAGDGDDAKPVPVTKIWLGHEARRTYINGLGLFPLKSAPEGYYNTWHGFSVDPLEGDCSLFLNHLKEIICDGSEHQYNWLITWLADLVQDPANPKGCAIVMRGGEGCGKGTFANAIGSLLGPHHRHLIDDTHLTSNFNSHLFDAITIFADEITWGGNKKTAGKLKGMVTEKYLIGERKGVDAIQYHNCCHLIVASNSEWVIPASFDSRRWFVLDVIPKKIGDFQYFGAIADELENGGMAALLYYLQNVKMGAKERSLIRQAPVTEALKVQRILNTQTDHQLRWWTKILESGDFPVMGTNAEQGWPEVVNKIDLYSSYEKYCMERNHFVALMSPWAARMINDFGMRTTKIRKDGGRINAYKVWNHEECIKLVQTKYPGLLSEDKDEDTGET